MAANTQGLNQIFPIYNEDGTSFHDLVLRKGVVDSIVMSLGDKITGDVFYKDNTLQVTMKEYVEYNGIHFSLVNPPTIVREGMVADNGELKGMTKYSFEFYHPMCQLSNFPFTDVATKSGEEKYLSQNKTFSWIGKPQDYIDKLNKNLQGTVWYVRKSDLFPAEKDDELSEVQQFDNVSVAEAIKRGYEIWEIPYIVSQLPSTDPLYAQGKRFVVEYGLPSNEIYENESARQLDTPYVFQMGQGVGLKNNSRTPRNNKIVTRIAGYGSEDNVPYGYPQIVWTGNQDWDYTIDNDPNNPLSYPIYKGIVGGQYVKLIKHPFTRTHLMPSIFTETVNKKVNPNAVGYDPTIEIKDYYDAVATQEYPYVNEINLQAPSYESHEFADIKPEFDSESSIGIISAIPLNSDLTPADHWDDSMDDDGNYLQSYFQITLPQLDFDLYACAAITQEMQINMRSGACIGCNFPIQVDWDDYKKNFYDEDGNFVPDGEQRDLTKYPKSNLGQINVVVQKDNSTFGTLMPNIYQQPNANDLFVFIGISLPVSYITNAEERLDDAMKTYMLENNVFYFDYPLKFDEHFLATHTYILEQIRPNSIIRFDYGGVEQQLFVKQLTVKYGNAPLPQYDITLTDNIEVVLNQIGQVADDVEKLSSLISVLRQSYSRNVWNELAKKLSKTQDDTAQGYIRFLKGLQVGSNFVPDILGEGGVLRMRDDGKVELVTDILYARVKAYFDTVEIREYKHTAGNRIASVAGNKCVRVAWFNSSNVELEQTPSNLSSVAYFRCYFRASDGDDTVRNNFSIGDQAYCHVTSIATGSDNPEEKGLNQKHFWRLVIGRNTEGTLTEDGEAYIDLSNRATETIGGASYEGYQSGSDVPQSQDDIIQLGNVNDTTRQGAIVEYVTGTDAPSYQIYQGINSFSLNGKNQIGFGYNTGTGRAYMNVYGDFRFGSRNNNGSYIKYNSQTGNLEIKAHVEFTNSDAELDTLVQEHQRDDSYDDSWIQPALDELQDQIDGAIETYYMVGAPAINLPPVISTQQHPYDDPWLDGTETQSERTKILNNHVGDLYYDKSTGHGYRFLYDDDSRTFVWASLTDEDIEAALEAANNAQATADGKMTIYSVWGAWVKNSVNTLKVGDLFIPANDTPQGGVTYKAKKVYKCTTEGTNSFQEIDYTDDTALNNFVSNTYNPFVTNIQGQVDGKAETWRQATNPANAWTTDADKIKHIGDLWMDTSSNGGKKTYIYVDKGSGASPRYAWGAQDVPDSVFDEIDGKADIFVSKPTTYNIDDLWIIENTTADVDLPSGCVKGDIVISSAKRTNSYNKTDWSKKDRYTDDTYAHGFDFLTSNLARLSSTEISGGLVLSSLIGLRDTNNLIQSGINGIIESAKKGNGIAAWYGGEQGDLEDQSHYTGVTRWAKSLFRFDGSGYLANGNITWNEQGQITIRNITTLSDSQNTNILNELATFNSAFSFGTSGQGSTTAIYITPNVPFSSLYIGTSDSNKKAVATQEWVNNNYVSAAFFNAIFQLQDANGNAISPNNATTAKDRLKILVGAYTDQYLSALGLNSSGGSGGGTGDVTWALLANNSDTRQVALSHLTGALSGYATQTWVGNNYLPLTGGTITGALYFGSSGYRITYTNTSDIPTLLLDSVNHIFLSAGGEINLGADNIICWGSIQAPSFIKENGTSAQFLKADGSVDSNTYVTSSVLSGYLPLTGGNLNGNLSIYDTMNIYSSSIEWNDSGDYCRIAFDDDGITVTAHGTGYVTANEFIKNGGTSAQFLKADGSVTTLKTINGNSLEGSGNIVISGNAELLIPNSNASSYDVSTWIPTAFTSYANIWGEKFKRNAISNNTGDIVFALRASQYISGATELCIAIDGDYYAGSGQYKVLHEANVKTINGQSIVGTGNINIQGGGGAYYDAEVEYLESTGGGQYIDTGWFASYSDGFVIETEYEFSSNGNRGCLLSNYDSGQSLSLETTTGPRFYFCQGLQDYTYPVSAGEKHTTIFSYVNNVYSLTVDGVLRHSVTSSYTVGYNYSAYMFLDREMRTDTFNKNLKIYRLKIKSGNNVVRDFIPVRIGNVGYMYDKVSGQLFGNSGTGSFVLGADKEYLPLTGGTITGNLTVNGAVKFNNNLTFAYDTGIKFGTDNKVKITRDSSKLLIVDEAGNDIIIGDYDNTAYTSIINDLQGCPSNSAYILGNPTWFILNDGTAQFKTVSQTSDLRKKTITGDVPINLYNVANAPLFKFTWNNETKYSGQHIGSAAQYWQTVLPELVSIGRDADMTLAMQYDVIALASAITVAKTVVNHEERIKILENENNALRRELEKLRESA